MSTRGYFRHDFEVFKSLSEAGFFEGQVPDYTPLPPPLWLLQPIDRWRWNRDKKRSDARVRAVREAWAAKGLIPAERAKAKP